MSLYLGIYFRRRFALNPAKKDGTAEKSYRFRGIWADFGPLTANTLAGLQGLLCPTVLPQGPVFVSNTGNIAFEFYRLTTEVAFPSGCSHPQRRHRRFAQHFPQLLLACRRPRPKHLAYVQRLCTATACGIAQLVAKL